MHMAIFGLNEETRKTNRAAASVLSSYKRVLDAISAHLKGLSVQIPASEISECFLGSEAHIDKSVFSKAKKWENGDESQPILSLPTLNARINTLALIFGNDQKIKSSFECICQMAKERGKNFEWRSRPIEDALARLKTCLTSGIERPSPSPDQTLADADGRSVKPLNNLLIVDDLELIGREPQLEKIFSLLSDRQKPTRLAICGEPGIGKTSLAKFVLKKSPHHVVKWFVDASNLPSLHAGLRSLASKLGVDSAKSMAAESDGISHPPAFLFDLHKRLGEMREAPVLILFDNLDHHGLWDAFKTLALNFVDYPFVDVLATTQVVQETSAALNLFRLLPIDKEACIKWLGIDRLKTKYAISESQYNDVIYLLGGRPLLLNLASSLLKNNFQFSELLELLNKNGDALLEDGYHEARGVAKVFDAAVSRAEEKCPGSRQLFYALAFLASEPIAKNLAPPGSQATAQQRAARIRQITSLEAGALLEQASADDLDYIALHRTTGLIVRQLALADGNMSVSFAAALDAIFDEVPDRVTMLHEDGRKKMSSFFGHIAALRQHASHYAAVLSSMEIRQKIALLTFHAAFFHRMNSEWAEAQASIRFACEWIDQENDPVRAALFLITAANIFRQTGNFSEAETSAAAAIPILKLSATTTDYAWGLTVQARILRNKPDGDASAAATLIDQALNVLNGPLVESTLQNCRQKSEALCYRSVLQRQLGQLEEAEKSATMGLGLLLNESETPAILSGDAFSDDPLVARHLRALGGIWRLQGRFEAAIGAQQAAVKAFERVYGHSSSDVGRALDTLGRAQRDWGEFDQAEQSFVHAEAINVARFGENYANSATAMVNRAIIRLEKGQGNEALALSLAAFPIYLSAYSEVGQIESFRNEATIWCKFVESEARSLIGEHSYALDQHVRILHWRQNKLGVDHPHVASSSLAVARQARLLEMKSVSGKQVQLYISQAKKIRDDHFAPYPNIWTTEVDIEQGLLCKDRDLLNIALETYQSILKRKHPRISSLKKYISDIGSI
jgi:tetratricopeptide (TPR) repeat protein